MKKAELEKEILELKEKVKLLEARPTCYGHFCGHYFCDGKHYNYPVNPSYLWYGATISGTSADKLSSNPTYTS